MRKFRRKLAAVSKLTMVFYILSTMAPLPAQAFDTDLFTSSSNSTAPNVLIVLDNTSNWARQSQQWPGTDNQGQSEVQAIKSVISALPGYVNVGMMELVTGGPAGDTGGYVRYAISPMGASQTNGAANKTAFSNILTTIYNNNTTPNEKQNSNVPYGDLLGDAYNYFAGNTPIAASADVVSSLADSNGYVSNYTKFKSPLSSGSSCAQNYIIFIGNPNSSGPANDSAANLTALSNAGGNTSQLALEQFSQQTPISSNLGYSASCYSSQPTWSMTTDAPNYTGCPVKANDKNATYDSCTWSSGTSVDKSTALDACSTGKSRYSVLSTGTTSSSSSSTTHTLTTGSSSCYTSSSGWTSSDHGGLTCPSNTTSTSGNTTTTVSHSCTYSVANTIASGSSCTALTTGPTAGSATTSTALSTSCYANANSVPSSDHGTLTCPSTTVSTSGSTTTTTTYSCAYSAGNPSSSTGCGSGKHFTITQTATPTVSTSTPRSQFVVTQDDAATTTVTTSSTTTTTLGNTFACSSSTPTLDTTNDLPTTGCPAGTTCSIGSATSSASCATGKYRYQALGYTATYTPANPVVTKTDTNTWNADEWARFMYQKGIAIPGSTTNGTVNTYTIDVYHSAQNADQSSLLTSMATAGGGRYFSATNASQISVALQNIFSEIQATNSTFASAALPISATNKTQNDNQVYIGMFRPDQQAFPRWFGNLKRYQFGIISGNTTLVDANGSAAVSTLTGFIGNCAQSYWTTDSGNTWANVSGSTVSPRIYFTTASSPGTAWTTQGDDTKLAAGSCTTLGSNYSDLPDGPIVEKGGAAEVLRKASSRTIKTIAALSGSTTVVDFNATNVTVKGASSSVNTNIVNFIKGQDVTGEINDTPSTSNRPSIHGDVVHSKPLAIDYGGSTGVHVFYGANDGTYRSVNASTGVENWSFVAPEFYLDTTPSYGTSSLQRLLDNSPVVKSPTPTPTGQTAASGSDKDFFFDGSTGLYQNSDNSKVWLYASMRRGGRMIYAFDATDPTTAKVLWKAGCNGSGCTDGTLTNIGQTWSTPNVAFLSGYSTTTPVVVFGGGYDTCEDTDAATTTCSSPKGAGVYVLDGQTGTVVKTFATDRSVAADIALVDVNHDGIADLGYAADTGGNIYRINFTDPSNSFAALAPASWTITKVAYTTGASRKFLFAPALLAYKNDVYVAIASGDREHPLALSYPYTTPVTNRFYVYLDDPTKSVANNLDGSSFYDYTTSASDTCSTPGVLPGNTKIGWFMDLTENGTGEQAVTSPLITVGLAAFSTNRPITSNVCSNDLGEARGYLVNLLNGSGAIGVSGTCTPSGSGSIPQRSSIFVGGGLPPSPVAGVVTIDGVAQPVTIGVAQKDGTTPSCSTCGQKLPPPITSKTKRIYWRTPADTH